MRISEAQVGQRVVKETSGVNAFSLDAHERRKAHHVTRGVGRIEGEPYRKGTGNNYYVQVRWENGRVLEESLIRLQAHCA